MFVALLFLTSSCRFRCNCCCYSPTSRFGGGRGEEAENGGCERGSSDGQLSEEVGGLERDV